MIFFSLFLGYCFAQQAQFDINTYKTFLESHKDLSSTQLLQMYPAGYFTSRINNNWESSVYSDSIDFHYKLTNNEKGLINKHGFVVTERLSYESFGKAFLDIYHNDLPVFISSDAILHAIHMSYDKILIDVERTILIPKLGQLLISMHSKMGILDQRYASNSNLKQMLKDVDVYLTIPRKLLGQSVIPYYTDNTNEVNNIMNLISTENAVDYPLFAVIPRSIDFSQFKVRGHYTNKNYPELSKYFQSMMWLGRIELYLSAPNALYPPTPQDVQRQTIDASLILELGLEANVLPLLQEMDDIIKFLVGESDNVTLPNIQELISSIKISSSADLLDTLILKRFQDTFKTKSYAFQRILSQILYSDPMSPDSIVPASSFLLLGQRFIIDSYVTGQVVYDRIQYKGEKILRMLPSTLDILFALGNNASAQLLQSELDKYHYSSNLSALRYLIDSYEPEFWSVSLYNLWLNSMRALNPPNDRNNLPSFMQTAAWWQEKMNSQLASWSQLRHDNLLYAKQSYSAGVICSYPYSYVEPIPAFYKTVKIFAQIAKSKFQDMPFPTNSWEKSNIINYFNNLVNIADTLLSISQKEINGELISVQEKAFLKKMLFEGEMCGDNYNGWYTDLFYMDQNGIDGLLLKNYIVADVHTAPTDEWGEPVGWILHGGTGKINMCIVIAKNPEGQTIAFIGPVMSYHEYVSTNFLRLSDEEWDSTYLYKSLRPSFTNLYLADKNGISTGSAPSLMTGINEPITEQPATYLLTQNYPNPFNSSTIIIYTIPSDLDNSKVELTIYNIQGKSVAKLVNNNLPEGNYMTRWDGRDYKGITVSSGTYYYELRIGKISETKKLMLMK
jgi:hypothetical protein